MMRARCTVLCGVVCALLAGPAFAGGTSTPHQHHVTVPHKATPHKAATATKTYPKQTAHNRRHTHAKHTARSSPRIQTGAPKQDEAKPLIVIDPGHGGSDPGAVGISGTVEKTVTLATALELRRLLMASGHYRVALTRTGDGSVSLASRLAFARTHDADLMIAIHADASLDRHARGASVYMIDQLNDDVRMVATPARTGHLYVLGARSIPSVLLEMGFLSNRQDEALLRRPAHRHLLVQAIKDAIDDYFAGIRRSRT
jgi:N-acetylmuramoyl-L-alanine amidase